LKSITDSVALDCPYPNYLAQKVAAPLIHFYRFYFKTSGFREVCETTVPRSYLEKAPMSGKLLDKVNFILLMCGVCFQIPG
jgi:hypothetical protein